MLKNLIRRVKSGIDQGMKQNDNDIDVDTLSDKLHRLQISLEKGEKEHLGEIDQSTVLIQLFHSIQIQGHYSEITKNILELRFYIQWKMVTSIW